MKRKASKRLAKGIAQQLEVQRKFERIEDKFGDLQCTQQRLLGKVGEWEKRQDALEARQAALERRLRERAT